MTLGEFSGRRRLSKQEAASMRLPLEDNYAIRQAAVDESSARIESFFFSPSWNSSVYVSYAKPIISSERSRIVSRYPISPISLALNTFHRTGRFHQKGNESRKMEERADAWKNVYSPFNRL